MDNERILDVDTDEEEVSELMHSETVQVGGQTTPLGAVVEDIHTAHEDLDEYKQASLSLAQTLSEASKEADDEVKKAVLSDLSDGAFATYLRLHRGDLELLGGRSGEYSDFL